MSTKWAKKHKKYQCRAETEHLPQPPQNYNRNSNKSQNEVFLKFFATVCIYVATELRQQGCCALEHQHTLMRNQRLSQHQGGRALWLLPHSPPPTHSCCND